MSFPKQNAYCHPCYRSQVHVKIWSDGADWLGAPRGLDRECYELHFFCIRTFKGWVSKINKILGSTWINKYSNYF